MPGAIHESHDFIDVIPNVILQLHKQMYRHTPSSMESHFKVGENEVRGIRTDGAAYARFKTVPAVAAEDVMGRLRSAYRDAIAEESTDPPLALLMLAFDFTRIHPFNDGNGRTPRIPTLLPLYKAGHLVGKCVSIEKKIERTKDAYYDTLVASSVGRHENSDNVGPFVRYMPGTILAAYRELEERMSLVSKTKLTKTERVEAVLRDSFGKVTKRYVSQTCPDINTTPSNALWRTY